MHPRCSLLSNSRLFARAKSLGGATSCAVELVDFANTVLRNVAQVLRGQRLGHHQVLGRPGPSNVS